MAQAERSQMQHIDAEEYFNKILKGHKNALTRPLNPTTDRVLRKLVEDANKPWRLYYKLRQWIL